MPMADPAAHYNRQAGELGGRRTLWVHHFAENAGHPRTFAPRRAASLNAVYAVAHRARREGREIKSAVSLRPFPGKC